MLFNTIYFIGNECVVKYFHTTNRYFVLLHRFFSSIFFFFFMILVIRVHAYKSRFSFCHSPTEQLLNICLGERSIKHDTERIYILFNVHYVCADQLKRLHLYKIY